MSTRRGAVASARALGLGALLAVAGCASAAALPLTSVAPGAPATAAPSAAGWPQVLHDSRHSGVGAAAGPATPAVRWQRGLEGPVTQGPVVGADGTIYAASAGGVLHALDPADGHDRWAFDAHAFYGSDLTTSPALLGDRFILWPGPASKLYVLDTSGHLITTVDRAGPVLSPSVVGPTDFYLADMSGELSAYRLAGSSVAQRWTIDLGDQSYGSPVVAPDGSLRQTVDSSVVAVQDGGDHAVELWRFSAHDISEVSAGVAPDGTTVFGTNDGAEYGIGPGGDERWKVDLGTYSSPAVTPDGTAYFGDNNGAVYVVRTSDGTVQRRIQAPAVGKRDESSLWSSPVIDGQGDVYYGSRDGYVYGYAADGRRLWALPAGAAVYSTGALTADGALVIGTEGKVLVCIGAPYA